MCEITHVHTHGTICLSIVEKVSVVEEGFHPAFPLKTCGRQVQAVGSSAGLTALTKTKGHPCAETRLLHVLSDHACDVQ